jgi:hypothetical protein
MLVGGPRSKTTNSDPPLKVKGRGQSDMNSAPYI